MKSTLLAILCLALALSSCKQLALIRKESKSPEKAGVSPTKKVLLLGIDGCRSDAFLQAKSPGLDSLSSSAFVSFECDRGPYTVSGPGWSTILHGVLPDKHKVFSNNFLTHDYGQFQDLFYFIREKKPELSLSVVAHWPMFLKITSNEDDVFQAFSDEIVKRKAIHMIKKFTPDVMLMHFNDVDHAGHTTGFDPKNKKYIRAIHKVGKHADDIMQAVKEREEKYNEEWLVIVCTDHGGYKLAHGNQDDLKDTRFVFSIFRLPKMKQKMIENAKNVDILPTILDYLDIEPDPIWGLDGKSIL